MWVLEKNATAADLGFRTWFTDCLYYAYAYKMELNVSVNVNVKSLSKKCAPRDTSPRHRTQLNRSDQQSGTSGMVGALPLVHVAAPGSGAWGGSGRSARSLASIAHQSQSKGETKLASMPLRSLQPRPPQCLARVPSSGHAYSNAASIAFSTGGVEVG